MNAPLKTFRDGIRKKSPPWLRRGTAEKILYSIGYHMDAFIDQAVAAVKLRFPGHYSFESLPLLSRARRIYRGRYETDAAHANRLLGWLDAHRTRGNAYAMLNQLHQHFAPNNFPIELLGANGRRYLMDTDGNITWDDVAWTPPGDPAKWARWWLLYKNPDFVGAWKWNDGVKWNDGHVWNSLLSPADVADLRLVPDFWNPAHAIGQIVLLDADEEWDSFPPGEWPYQLSLSVNTMAAITPVSQDDINGIESPVSGNDAIAEVVQAALQKIANSLLWLKREKASRIAVACESDLAQVGVAPGDRVEVTNVTFLSGGMGTASSDGHGSIALPNGGGVYEVSIRARALTDTTDNYTIFQLRVELWRNAVDEVERYSVFGSRWANPYGAEFGASILIDLDDLEVPDGARLRVVNASTTTIALLQGSAISVHRIGDSSNAA